MLSKLRSPASDKMELQLQNSLEKFRIRKKLTFTSKEEDEIKRVIHFEREENLTKRVESVNISRIKEHVGRGKFIQLDNLRNRKDTEKNLRILKLVKKSLVHWPCNDLKKLKSILKMLRKVDNFVNMAQVIICLSSANQEMKVEEKQDPLEAALLSLIPAAMNATKRIDNLENFKYLYNGEFNEEGLYHGHGILYKKSKSVIRSKYKMTYQGEFRNGLKHGIGREFHPSKSNNRVRFFGQYRAGKRHGRGILFPNPKGEVWAGKGSIDWDRARCVEFKEGEEVPIRRTNEVPVMNINEDYRAMLGNYEVFKHAQLGKGACGQVFKMFVKQIGKEVAFKFFPQVREIGERIQKPEFDSYEEEEEREKTFSEITDEKHIMSKLEHENIIKILGVSTEYPAGILMELMDRDGEHHINLLRRKDLEVRLEEVVNILLGVGKGMEYLHANHILHRDLKWKNVTIKLEKRGRVSVVTGTKIVDFGLSKETISFISEQNTTRIGTMFYMAPEVSTSRYSYPIDVYSFGVMIYFAIVDGKERRFKVVVEEENIARVPVFPDGLRDRYAAYGYEWVVDLMIKCISFIPEERPTFSDIVGEISCKVLKLGDQKIVLDEEEEEEEEDEGEEEDDEDEGEEERM